MKFYAFGFSIGMCLSGLFNDGRVSHIGLCICLALSIVGALESLTDK